MTFPSLFFSAETYNTTEELLQALYDGKVDGIMVNMYLPVKRKALFNWTSLQVDELIKCQSLYGVLLKHEAVSLAKDIKQMVSRDNLQSNFLVEKDENLEEVCIIFSLENRTALIFS